MNWHIILNGIPLIDNRFTVADANVDKVHVMIVGIYSDSPSTFEYIEGESAQTLWPPSKQQ